MKSKYLKLSQVVIGEGSCVGDHGDIAVELCQTGLAHFGPVLPQIRLPQVELPHTKNKDVPEIQNVNDIIQILHCHHNQSTTLHTNYQPI